MVMMSGRKVLVNLATSGDVITEQSAAAPINLTPSSCPLWVLVLGPYGSPSWSWSLERVPNIFVPLGDRPGYACVCLWPYRDVPSLGLPLGGLARRIVGPGAGIWGGLRFGTLMS